MENKNRVFAYGMIFILFGIILGSPFVGIQGWWNNDWEYNKTCNINNKIDNYQMKIVIDFNASVGGDVSCLGHCQTDFDDIRFVYDNVTVLPYVKENYTSSTQATFWLNNTDNYSTFEIYYGNSSATDISNGNNVFLAFDNEDWSTDWTNNYVSTENVIYKRGASSLKYDGLQQLSAYDWWNLTYNMTNANEYAFGFYYRSEDSLAHGRYHILTQRDVHGPTESSVSCRDATNDYKYYDGIWNAIHTISIDTWYRIEFTDIEFNDDTFDVWVDTTKKVNDGSFRNAVSYSKFLQIGSSTNTVNVVFYIDFCFLRLWNDTEPSWGSFGSEKSK